MNELIITCWLFWTGASQCIETKHLRDQCQIYKEQMFFETKEECEAHYE